jgi:thiol-disulfide isomerase/thioredoxin
MSRINPSNAWPRWMLVVLLLVVFPAGCAPVNTRSPVSAGLPVGQFAPPVRAHKWIRGESQDGLELKGEVTVLIAWAYWCQPCRREATHLVAFHKQFKERGVRFIGLTTEGVDAEDRSEAFLADAGIEWPNGLGAIETLSELQAESIPSVWLVGRDGRIVWNMASETSLESAIEAALQAAPPAADAPADNAAGTPANG